MTFSLKKWRKTYDLVHGIGRKLSDSRPTINKNGKVIKSLCPLAEEEVLRLEKKIQMHLDKLCNYMDYTGMNLKPGLWVYSKTDPTTWASHDTFKYSHLLKRVGSKIRRAL